VSEQAQTEYERESLSLLKENIGYLKQNNRLLTNMDEKLRKLVGNTNGR